MHLAQPQPHVDINLLPPPLVAALLLGAREPLQRLGLPAPSAARIFEATGAKRSRSYQLMGELVARLPDLQRPVGRPTKPTPEPVPSDSAPAHQVRLAVLRLLKAHPGCLRSNAARTSYTDVFSRAMVRLREQYAHMELEDFAAAADIPLGTLKEWLRPRRLRAATDAQSTDTAPAETSAPSDTDQQTEHAPTPEPDHTDSLPAHDRAHQPTEHAPTPGPDHTDSLPAHDRAPGTAETGPPSQPTSTSPWIQTVVTEWQPWDGTLDGFCQHIYHHCRIPLKRTSITAILEAHGLYVSNRRPGRTPDKEALRGAFETFFPGAQWVGDGTTIRVVLDDQSFDFNLELFVDTYSDAFVGLNVSHSEDSQAVQDAFAAGVHTTGQAPIASLLDNRPSNHTPEVHTALGDTIVIRSTPRRAQNKAHVEGAFGLFAQVLPALILLTSDPAELARQIVLLVATTWARAMNHKPRRDRNGRSRFQLYADTPTEEQIAQARAALLERHRKQELARQTTLARQDPLTRQLLDEAFTRLGLSDPGHHFRAAIACHGREAIIEGIAIFENKMKSGTLPDGVDARYLLKIINNVSHDNEACDLAAELLDRRLEARELAFEQLQHQLHQARQDHPDPQARTHHCVDQALAAHRKIDRLFWLVAAADTIDSAAPDDHTRAHWIRYAAATINLCQALSHRDRMQAIRFLARQVLPLA